MKTVFALAFFALFAQPFFAQKPTLALTDFLKLVRKNHPEARRADNFLAFGEAEIRAAKGAFDPKIFGDFENKTFDGKNYFSLGEAGAKLPTRFGTEFKASYSTATGVFLNESDKLPAAGQAVLGISQPILQGLLFDERRANRRRATQTQAFLAAERQNALNDLAFEATETYWKWAFADAQKGIFEAALEAATARFEGIKTSWKLGERMAMDTLESFIQVQDRQLLVQQSALDQQAFLAKMRRFFWQNAGESTVFVENMETEKLAEPTRDTPFLDQKFDLKSDDVLASEGLKNHPALVAYSAKIGQLEVEKRLKKEKLRPRLNLNYNFLGNGGQFSNLLTDNHKWGLELGSPIFFRTERAEVELANLKIQNTQLERDQKRRDLEAKLQIARAEWQNGQSQMQLAAQVLENYRQLLQLEITRFELGESTFFLINSREMKFIEAQIKLAKLQTEQKIRRAALDWAVGRITF